ncbi:MAG: hypothetical protein AAGI22_01790 [Planctomycetota bacterium]
MRTCLGLAILASAAAILAATWRGPSVEAEALVQAEQRSAGRATEVELADVGVAPVARSGRSALFVPRRVATRAFGDEAECSDGGSILVRIVDVPATLQDPTGVPPRLEAILVGPSRTRSARWSGFEPVLLEAIPAGEYDVHVGSRYDIGRLASVEQGRTLARVRVDAGSESVLDLDGSGLGAIDFVLCEDGVPAGSPVDRRVDLSLWPLDPATGSAPYGGDSFPVTSRRPRLLGVAPGAYRVVPMPGEVEPGVVRVLGPGHVPEVELALLPR